MIRRISLSLLIPYLFLVAVATILSRAPSEDPQLALTPFASFKDALTDDFWEFEVQANILLFIPVGFLLSSIKRHSMILPVILGTSMSIGIEIVQFLTKRGTCEVDDLISNFFGLLIGCLVFLPFRVLNEMDSGDINDT